MSRDYVGSFDVGDVVDYDGEHYKITNISLDYITHYPIYQLQGLLSHTTGDYEWVDENELILVEDQQ